MKTRKAKDRVNKSLAGIITDALALFGDGEDATRTADETSRKFKQDEITGRFYLNKLIAGR